MKYKVGDKVRVRKDLVIDSSYGREDFVEEMKSFIGKVVTISKVIDEEYLILEDDGDYAWTEEMFEGANIAPSITKRINDKHNILNGLLNSDGSVDGEKLMEKLESNSEEPEKTINLLREMKHNCEHANNYDDPKRHDKAKALGFAIELIEHDYSATELNYKPEKLMEKLSNQSGDSNAMAKGSHYEKSAMQPLEVSQALLTKEQFEGALLFNIIKYRMRKKGQDESDAYKARQYAYWLEMVKEGRTINPSKDKVPFDYKFSII